MSTCFVVCLSAVSFSPGEPVAVDKVDLVEINHFFDEQGRLVFDQVIFYEWCPRECRYQVRDWRLLKSDSQVPLRNWRDGNFVAIWHDFKDCDILRRVSAAMIRETWTQYDPELAEREYLRDDQRRLLSKRAPRTNPRTGPVRGVGFETPAPNRATAGVSH
jgi:hypothetical protein